MAIRNIRKDGADDILRKISRPVQNIGDRVLELLDDMAETMYEANGVGLAAVQVGILKRIIVIDIGEGLIEIINPEIISESGEQTEAEGCLSCPGRFGEVVRPEKVAVKGLNRKGKEIKIEGNGFLSKALCHEIDHLNGILFIDKVVRFIDEKELEDKEGEE